MSITKNISELPCHPDPVTMKPDLDRAHEIFEQLADQYGKIFMVQFANQPMVVVSDAKLINFVLCKRQELFGPYHRNSKILEAIKSDGIEAADDHDWKQQREIIAASMESSHLNRYFENIKAVTEDLKNRWIAYGENLSKTDLEAEIFGFSISVFTAIVFGDMADKPEDERETAKNLLHNLLVILSKRIDALLPQMHLESFTRDKDFDEQIKEVLIIIESLIAHNRNLLTDNNGTGKAANMLQVLIEIMEEKGVDIRNVKLIENILLILLASEPTTADTLLRVLHYIGANPQVQKEIQDEVDAILGKCDIIENIKDIKKLRCIDAVIYESMRMSPVARFVLVEAKVDLLLDDIEIPCGTPLVLLIAYCAMDEENFHQAATFEHRRWCSESKEDFSHNNKAFLGFGAGPRSCPGRGLAMLVMKTVLAMICGNFQICLVSGKPVLDETVSKDKPFPLDFTVEIRGKNHDFEA
ncbi:cytochrome P450 [Methylicorpusculum sp.]|uniref:cytochrome P450 n=1 Tax=Methylicorpusculum sp. TaxID=2713644 RepID=UPI00271AEB28|nr:cytochrome P450 [Methylicorpusculum sp.]MDO8844057.1 cytochrome P450 [Methylicorpusculum sp.]